MSFNMFSSINFLFLISLAVTSWILLCYFKHIEPNSTPEINIDFNIDHSMDKTLTISPISCRLSENYDLYLNFLCIFACVYALAKVTQFTESFIAKQVNDHFGKYDDENITASAENSNVDDDIQSSTVDATATTSKNICCPLNSSYDYTSTIAMNIIKTPTATTVGAVDKSQENLLAQNQELCLEIANLKKQNSELEQRLNDAVLEKPNYIVVGNGVVNREMDVVKYDDDGNEVLELQLQQKKSSTSSIFVTNHHFNLNRQVFVNEGNVKLNFQDSKKEGGDFSQVWQKYLEMPKYSNKIPKAIDSSNEMDANFPTVISTQELKAMEGPFYLMNDSSGPKKK